MRNPSQIRETYSPLNSPSQIFGDVPKIKPESQWLYIARDINWREPAVLVACVIALLIVRAWGV